MMQLLLEQLTISRFIMVAENRFRNLSQIVQMVNDASRSRAPIQTSG
jgi:hypothetical protein